MQIKELAQFVVNVLEAHKAVDITVLDVTSLSNFFDMMIICSATSKRHASSMAEKLVRAVKEAGIKPYGITGEKEGEWVLIDLTDIIVHIMLPEVREFYSLEKLWSTALATRSNPPGSSSESSSDVA